jgi:DNA-binding SARP family transcriptional activator
LSVEDRGRLSGSPHLKVGVLGLTIIEDRGKRLVPRRRATSELLAYLAVNHGGGTREQLLEALWPDEDPLRTRGRLWQSTSEARRLLGEGFVRVGDRYKLDRKFVTTDADEVEEALGRSDLGRAAVDGALAQFRGDALESAGGPWAAGERRRLRALHAELAERAARFRLDGGDVRGALAAAEAGLRSDELNERLWRLAMEAEGALGLRASVTDRYGQLCELVDARLGLQPESETRRLYRSLLAQS